MALIQSDPMHAAQQQPNTDTSDTDGTWLLITSTMGLTLGYVRIDDHDHELSLSEIRDMIHDKLKDNSEYCHGFNFGRGWPLKIVLKDEEATVLAQDVLPSVSVLSAHSAQHIANNNNPIFAATAMQYGMMNFMQFPQTANSANLQPLPMSAIFTPIHQITNQINKLPSSEQYYSPNTVALLQPQPQSQAVKAETHTQSAMPQLSAMSNTSNAEIPALPPFSPPILSQHDIEQKQKTQKQKLQNLLPISKKTESKIKAPMNIDINKNANRNTPKNRHKAVVLPRLKAVGADGKIIEMNVEHKTADDNERNTNQKKKTNRSMPDKQAQKDLFCPECEKTFANERGYRLHMTKQHKIKLARGRNKERRFRCDFDGCDRSFYQSSDLRRHQRVHLGVKPFKCSVCKKEFTQRGSLYRHIKSSHKGQDPKRLIILQTEETLPVNGQKQKKTEDMNTNTNIPPLISGNDTNNLPPKVNHNANVSKTTNDMNANVSETTNDMNANVDGVPPPLIGNVNNNDNDVKMIEKHQMN